jgi:hypothetical protein
MIKASSVGPNVDMFITCLPVFVLLLDFLSFKA